MMPKPPYIKDMHRYWGDVKWAPVSSFNLFSNVLRSNQDNEEGTVKSFHRIDGPAYEESNSGESRQVYYVNGKRTKCWITQTDMNFTIQNRIFKNA